MRARGAEFLVDELYRGAQELDELRVGVLVLLEVVRTGRTGLGDPAEVGDHLGHVGRERPLRVRAARGAETVQEARAPASASTRASSATSSSKQRLEREIRARQRVGARLEQRREGITPPGTGCRRTNFQDFREPLVRGMLAGRRARAQQPVGLRRVHGGRRTRRARARRRRRRRMHASHIS